MFARIKPWAVLAVACLLLVPTLIYMSGWMLVGPYEGESGLFGLVKSIYGDALTGDLAAWFLLLSPVILVWIWTTCLSMQRKIRARLA